MQYVKWEYTTTGDLKPCWQLMVGHNEPRRSAATVWLTGVWHTWDENGVGGENSAEWTRAGKPDVNRAKIEAAAAAIAQGFI